MKIVTHTWVFLTRSGIGLKDLRLIEETIHQYKGKRNHFWKYALFQFIFRKKIKLRGKYFIIHNHWCPGYYHWITEALPRLFHVRAFLDHHILLLPESFKGMPLDSIEPLYGKEVYWIPMNKNMVLESLMIPESPLASGVYEKEIFFKLRNLYSEAVMEKNIKKKFGSKIYASRSKALRRKVANENEVTATLAEYGFTIINFEDHSFWEQVAMMQQADVLVSVHGAGLSNVLFMREGSRVIELQKEPVNMGEAVDVLYKDFSKVMRVKYDVLFCKPVNKNEALYQADIIVNWQSLKDLLTF